MLSHLQPKLRPTLLLLLALLLLLQLPGATLAKSKNKNKSNQNTHYSDSSSSSSGGSSSSSSSSATSTNDEREKIKSHNDVGQHFAMEPQDQTAVVGSRVTLPCRVMQKVGALQWTKDDFGLGQHRNLSGFERYSMVGSDEEGDFSLDIYPLMLDDDAKYQCQVGPGPLGEQGIRSRFANLTVLVPPEAPKIQQGDYLVTTEDREIELECISEGGKPAAEITWIDGLGNVLQAESFFEPLSDSRRVTTRSVLKLAPKKKYHNTTITCHAQNTADRTHRSAKVLLEVKYAPKVTVSVVGGALAGGRIPEGAEVILSCQADANPREVTYRWFINDELMAGDFTTKMIIHNVTRQYHGALVKCEVANAVGKSEQSQKLDISFGPVFQQRPVSQEADLGATVTMHCKVAGNPTPEIEWINENSDQIVGHGPEYKVKVTSESAGRYFCKAVVNGFPEIGAEATVYVKRAPIITSHKAQFGAVGSRAKLDCSAFSIPKAEHILWSFEGKPINMSSDDPDIYIFEEHHLPEGVRAALIIKESRSTHYGRYNCTVLNAYGGDSLIITLVPEPGSISVLLVGLGSISLVGFILSVVMVVIVYRRLRSRKKPMPADVIPEASRGGDKLNELKSELRAKAYDVEYSEAGSDGLAINLTQTPMPDVQMKGATLGVPLAGPVKFDDYGERYQRQCQLKNMKNQQEQVYKESASNGYAPYFEYALDYSPPADSGKSKTAAVAGVGVGAGTGVNSATLPHYAANAAAAGAGAGAGITAGGSSGVGLGSGASLPRNQRHELHQQQPQTSQANGFLGQPLLQNGIDSRFSAIYGNPYLRTNSSILPPLPPPSTANPAATPAPPPYHAARHANSNGGLKHFGAGGYGAASVSINAAGSASASGGPGSVSGSSSNLTASSNTLAATPLTQPSLCGPMGMGVVGAQMSAQSPSGQFILPNNGKGVTQKGPLATHV
ncbi:hypothetical protein KR222_001578 [Zaprionus bogoriensis]|nr:hypothetical protein KR222_001578 [Zaprionus bogoriensis]